MHMLITDTLLRDFEMQDCRNRRDLDMLAKQTMPLVDIAAETAAQRRLMEDKSSPTKISQQRLRAQHGRSSFNASYANQASWLVLR